MRGLALSLLALTCVSMALAQAPQIPNLKQQATKTATVYPIVDLPVWTKFGTKLDSSILIELIKAKVAPGKWEELNYSIVSHEGNLVISTTVANHEAIRELLSKFRKAP